MAKTPSVLWAQRKDCLLVTLDVQDCKDAKVKVDKDASEHFALLRFSGKAGEGGEQYAMNMELLKEVNPEETKVSTTGRSVFLMIPKKEEGFWPKLLRQKAPPNVKVDWSKWVDSDDEGVEEPFDMSQMGDFSGLGGMESSDSDDDMEDPAGEGVPEEEDKQEEDKQEEEEGGK